MEKRDIYEHLANVYLDTPLKRNNHIKDVPRRSWNHWFTALAVLLVILAIVVGIIQNNNNRNLVSSETTYVLLADTVKLGFSFDPGKKEIYSINLNKLNLNKYKALGVSLKKSDRADSVALRIEFTNSFKEKSEIYIQDLTNTWKEYKINLSDFKNITDWTEMQNIFFVIEEWNAQGKKGAIYIDKVVFLK